MLRLLQETGMSIMVFFGAATVAVPHFSLNLVIRVYFFVVILRTAQPRFGVGCCFSSWHCFGGECDGKKELPQ